VFGLRKNKEIFILHSIVLSQLLIYICLYIFTYGNAPDSSIERLLMHLAPIALFSIALNLKSLGLTILPMSKNKYLQKLNKFPTKI